MNMLILYFSLKTNWKIDITVLGTRVGDSEL